MFLFLKLSMLGSLKNKCSNVGFRRRELDILEMQELMAGAEELHYYLAADGVEDTMYDDEWLGF